MNVFVYIRAEQRPAMRQAVFYYELDSGVAIQHARKSRRQVGAAISRRKILNPGT